MAGTTSSLETAAEVATTQTTLIPATTLGRIPTTEATTIRGR